MKRKDYEAHYDKVKEYKEVLKKRLEIDDRLLLEICIDVLSETVFNSNFVDEFSGCLCGETETAEGKIIHYNFSLGKMGKELNMGLYKTKKQFC